MSAIDVGMEPADQLTFADFADLAGVTTRSLRVYRERKVIPEPDGYLGSTPWWRRSTVERWLETRARRGEVGRGRPKPKEVEL